MAKVRGFLSWKYSVPTNRECNHCLHRTFVYMLFSNKLVRSVLKLISIELCKFPLQELIFFFLIPEEPFDSTIRMSFFFSFESFASCTIPHFTSSACAIQKLMSKSSTRSVYCVWSQIMTQNISVVCEQPACQNESNFS